MTFFWALYKKDLRSLFRSPQAFAFLTVFVFLAGLLFYRGMLYFSAVSMQAPRGMVLNVNQAVFEPLYSNLVLILVLLIPLLTMRIFSEEKKTGTLELLLSYPSSGTALTAAKFSAVFTVFFIGLAVPLAFPVIAAVFGRVDWGPIASAFIGLVFSGALLLSIGTFFSSLTENQILAALGSMGTAVFLWILGWIGSYLPSFFARLITGLSLHDRLVDAFRGVLNTDDLFFFVNFSLLLLSLTVMHVDSERLGG